MKCIECQQDNYIYSDGRCRSCTIQIPEEILGEELNNNNSFIHTLTQEPVIIKYYQGDVILSDISMNLYRIKKEQFESQFVKSNEDFEFLTDKFNKYLETIKGRIKYGWLWVHKLSNEQVTIGIFHEYVSFKTHNGTTQKIKMSDFLIDFRPIISNDLIYKDKYEVYSDTRL